MNLFCYHIYFSKILVKLSIPIIALTANVFFDDIIQAQRAGMNDHIAKPIDIDNLTSILEKYI